MVALVDDEGVVTDVVVEGGLEDHVPLDFRQAGGYEDGSLEMGDEVV